MWLAAGQYGGGGDDNYVGGWQEDRAGYDGPKGYGYGKQWKGGGSKGYGYGGYGKQWTGGSKRRQAVGRWHVWRWGALEVTAATRAGAAWTRGPIGPGRKRARTRGGGQRRAEEALARSVEALADCVSNLTRN